MKTYNEVVDNLEALEKDYSTNKTSVTSEISDLDTRVSALEESVTPEPVYNNNFLLYQNTNRIYQVSFSITSKNTGLIGYSDLRDFLYVNGAVSSTYVISASGYFINANNSHTCLVHGIYSEGKSANSKLVLVGTDLTDGTRNVTLTTVNTDYLHKVVNQ